MKRTKHNPLISITGMVRAAETPRRILLCVGRLYRFFFTLNNKHNGKNQHGSGSRKRRKREPTL